MDHLVLAVGEFQVMSLLHIPREIGVQEPRIRFVSLGRDSAVAFLDAALADEVCTHQRIGRPADCPSCSLTVSECHSTSAPMYDGNPQLCKALPSFRKADSLQGRRCRETAE